MRLIRGIITMTIEQQTMAEILKLGGQYFVPIAALLRALYSGLRGRFPQGMVQIAAASLFAGILAVVGNQQLDVRSLILKILGNTVFMAGLLAFTMVYLLRQPNRGKTVDAIVGGVIGLIVWLVWTFVLQENWPWWSLPLAIAAGAAGYVVLRILLRQIARLVKLATYLLAIGIVLIIGGGGILLLQTLLQKLATAP
jgi:hypothetical protein